MGFDFIGCSEGEFHIFIDLVAYDRHLHAFPDGISIRPVVSEAIGLHFQDLGFGSVI